MNNKWQRILKDEKDRRRNACLVERMKNDFTEKDDSDKVVLDEALQDLWATCDGFDTLIDSSCITPVTKIPTPEGTTRELTAQQFTLNKNQKAAFMIITGHLDGVDKANGGKAV